MESSSNGNHDDGLRRDRMVRLLARAQAMGIAPERIVLALGWSAEADELLGRLGRAGSPGGANGDG